MACKICGEEIVHNLGRCLAQQHLGRPKPPPCAICGDPATVRAVVAYRGVPDREQLICAECAESLEYLTKGSVAITEEDWA